MNNDNKSKDCLFIQQHSIRIFEENFLRCTRLYPRGKLVAQRTRMCRKHSDILSKILPSYAAYQCPRTNLTYQCSCSSLDYELSDQSLRLFGVPSEFVTQQTSESRRTDGVKYTASFRRAAKRTAHKRRETMQRTK